MMPGTASAVSENGRVDVEVLQSNPERIVLRYDFGEFKRHDVDIDGQLFTELYLGRESLKKHAGDPAVVDVSRSVMIPNDARMEVTILDSSYYEIKGIDIAPSKGYIFRNVDPDDVPYTFGDTYQTDAFYPGPLAVLHDPYVMRDVRGAVVTANPFQYNPVTHILRVYTEMTIEVSAVGPGEVNVLMDKHPGRALSLAFYEMYDTHFVNYSLGDRYAPLDEVGDMLIIVHDAWMANVQPLADHKNAIGINTTVVGVSTIGNNYTAIKAYIQNLYNTTDLAFVLLVGDGSEVDTGYAAGGSSDPNYSLVAGSDSYPDIFIGRFSAQTPDQVDTQVQRTIEYEQMPATEQDWFWRGMGVASDQGAGIGDDGEADYVHMGYIRDDLLGYGFTEVDEIYDPGASASQVSAGVNAGRGIINYCGHGSTTSWGTTGFSTSNINSLTNDNMLPFIISVACVNGQFDGLTCFAEAWLRATHNGEPTGAIGVYASSINQSWAPPMAGQDEVVDLFVAETYSTYGALCYAGSCMMMDDYPGTEGSDMFKTWHVFGDPSLVVVGTAAPPTGMRVTPTGGLNAEGPNGGPFTPDSAIYTLTNYETYPLDFTVAKTASWIDLSTMAGQIPAEGTVQVTVSINGTADNMGNGFYSDDVVFTNTTNHDGDTARTITLEIGVPMPVYLFPMDTNPGWTTEGQWAFGDPTGNGGEYGGPDPNNGHTGSNVFGYNLNGDYANYMPEYDLTTTAIDCSDLTQVTLKFWRWLGVEQSAYDHAYVRVSNNGTNWTQVWTNGAEVSDYSWTQQEYDISAVANNQSTVYIRWTMGSTDSSWRYCGWNIDDVEIWAVEPEEDCPEDLSGDGYIGQEDLGLLLSAYEQTAGGDIDGDGDTDQADLGLLLTAYDTPCP